MTGVQTCALPIYFVVVDNCLQTVRNGDGGVLDLTDRLLDLSVRGVVD